MSALSGLRAEQQAFRDDLRAGGLRQALIDAVELFRAKRNEKTDDFDERHGVSTRLLVPMRRLGGIGVNGPEASHYYPTSRSEFAAMMADLTDIEHEDCVFVDLGCGLGRVVLLAAGLPFKRVLGVDFSPWLLERAEQNLASYNEPLRAGGVELHLADVVDYPMPDDNLVVYMFDPFGPKIVSQVMANLTAPGGPASREVWVVYYSPSCDEEVRAAGFSLVTRGKLRGWPWHIYRWSSP